MTDQLMNHADHCLPGLATARGRQPSMPWRWTPIGGLWSALCGRLAGSFRRRAICAQPNDRFARPDPKIHLRREVLRIDARRIL
jgi:hypothetical protein